MDELYEIIKEIREENGMEYSYVPKSFFNVDKTKFVRNINLLINESYLCTENNDFKGCVNNLLYVIMFLLDNLVQQGIYPDSILKLMIKDDFNKVWPDGKLHYDNHGKIALPSNYESISNDIDLEILCMKERCYEKGENTISKYYNDLSI